MLPKSKIAMFCVTTSLASFAIVWTSSDSLNKIQWFALLMILAGTTWLLIPAKIKQTIETLLSDPRYADIDWPDEWSDFVAISIIIVTGFLLFL